MLRYLGERTNTADQVVASAHGDEQTVSMANMGQWEKLPVGLYTIQLQASALNYSGARQVVKR